MPEPRRRRTIRQSIRKQFEVREEHVAPCIKFTLFITNTIAWVISVCLTGVGIYSRVISDRFFSLSGFTTDPAVLLIAVGAIFTCVGFLGAIGSLRENVVLLKWFHYILIFMLFAELVSGLLMYFLSTKVKTVAIEQTTKAISQYQTTNAATALDDAIREVQIRFQCCGAIHPSDWRVHSKYFQCTEEVFTEIISSCGVPSSCCKKEAATNAQCGFKVFPYANMSLAKQNMYPRISRRNEIIWTTGCVEAVFEWIKSNWLVLGILCGVVIIIQLIGIEFSRRLMDQIWYLQTQMQ
ncbi:tetraspanin-33-like [Sycon ciliatum]|uniref:tetraspanin-33-like n=1 Tax=Sycon ciliatum TaxID=27933 RepID=UPI0020AE1BA5|eukprot:scpid72132/ scgid19973/ Tetraspanin-33; Penumbra; Proerythroblast new membrane